MDDYPLEIDANFGPLPKKRTPMVMVTPERYQALLQAERQRVFRQNGPDENPEPLPVLSTSDDTIYDDDFDGSPV